MSRMFIILSFASVIFISGAAVFLSRKLAVPVDTNTSKSPPAADVTTAASSSLNMEKSVSFKIASPAFADKGAIPSVYSCDEEGKSPPLSFEGVSENARSLALIVEDPDVPKTLKPDGLFVHWVLFDIPPETTDLPAGSSVGIEGSNSAGKSGYYPPCPPPQYEPSTHRYIFTLYALDDMLELQHGATHDEVLAAMQGHIITESQLVGTYSRKK